MLGRKLAKIYEVCSESNVQGKISPIRMVLKLLLFRNFLRPSYNRDCFFLAAVHLLPNDDGGLVFGTSSDNPPTGSSWSSPGSWEASQLSGRENVHWSNVWQVVEACWLCFHLRRHLKSQMRRRHSLGRRPFTKTGPGTTIWDFLAWK